MQFYISHSRENASVALRLTDALAKRGVQTWLDVRDLELDASWNEKVSRAIQDADAWLS